MKKYENPMLSIVSISNNDIIVTSFENTHNAVAADKGGDVTGFGFAPSRFDEWEEGF